jgi:hypothetical protein
MTMFGRSASGSTAATARGDAAGTPIESRHRRASAATILERVTVVPLE